MNKTQFRISAATVLPAVATMLFINACGGGGDASAQATGEPIEGVWEAVVTQRNCSTGAAVSTFASTQVFHRGGTFGDTSSHSPTARGPAYGVWTRSADTYTVKFRFYRYNPDGSLAGSSVSTMTATLAADGRTFTSTRSTLVLDPAGNTLATVCTTDAGTRFQ